MPRKTLFVLLIAAIVAYAAAVVVDVSIVAVVDVVSVVVVDVSGVAVSFVIFAIVVSFVISAIVAVLSYFFFRLIMVQSNQEAYFKVLLCFPFSRCANYGTLVPC